MVDTDDIAKLCANHGPVTENAHFEAGTVFGDWRLTGFIGRGGNGETYCAEHVKLGTPAAVKVLIRGDERAKARFTREAELLAKLRSDAFPRFFAYGEDNGRPYLAMELLEPGGLPKGDRAVGGFMLKICDAVAELHAMNVVHRDIKPANILYRSNGNPVLCDLGLLKQLQGSGESDADGIPQVSSFTGVVGTPGYGAPEQMERGEVTIASDIHALGVLAERCFGGRLSWCWRRIIQCATSSIPSLRYPNVPAFAHAIRFRHFWRQLFVALAAICVAAGIVWYVLVMAGEVRYCVVDLSGGPDAESYPVSYLKKLPTGWTKEHGWPDAYKTTKLVLRLVGPGSFVMGSLDDPEEARKPVFEFTKPFYIGVFEVTQRQYELVTGKNPSVSKGTMRPVENVSWADLRGPWQKFNWPEEKGVSPDTFIGKLRAKTGLCFDLPTEAQWEFACRAGTKGSFNSGGNTVEALNRLGRFAFNQNVRGWLDRDETFVRHRADGKGGHMERHTIVGSYLPNRWGLYDMHGNVSEFCLDWYSEMSSYTDISTITDNKGERRVRRGGSWNNLPLFCTSYFRDLSWADHANESFGFRLVIQEYETSK